jgi:hypothetical protein
VDVVGIGGGYLLVLMIETPYPFHTHSRSSLYIYIVFQHLLQFLVVIKMPPHPYIHPLGVDVVGIGGRYLLVLTIEASHPLHTHSRSSLYIYIVFQHLLQFLVVIRMPPHPYIQPLGVDVKEAKPLSARFQSGRMV